MRTAFLFFLLIFFLMPLGQTQTPIQKATSGPENQSLVIDQRSATEQELIETNIAIAEWFDGMAEGIDVFIAGKKLTPKRNESQLKLNFSSYVDENGVLTNSRNAGFNLHLPNFQEYWNLKFTSYDERQRRGIKKVEPIRGEVKENYGASVGFFRKLGEVRTSFEPRVELQNPLRISHSLTFESLVDNKPYHFNPKIEFFANPDRGTGVYQALDLNYNLNRIYGITLINEGEYFDREALYQVKNGISLGQFVTPTASFGYTFIIDSNNRPNYHMEAYTISVSWNHTVYKKILDYAITPLLSFPREKNFTGTPGVGASMGLTF